MHQDLARLIELQRLDTAARDAERRLADEPERLTALDARLEAATEQVAAAKARLADSQAARRAIEKDVAVHQGRLSKFREQAMAVKTNQEYHAIQHEIGFAQTQIQQLEDGILAHMMEADDLNAAVKQAEAALAAEHKAADAEKKAIAAENGQLKSTLEKVRAERNAVAASVTPQVLRVFELVAGRRHGIALAEARDGICTICHVRLRPQVFNTVRRNEEILQCDSCNRILYFVPPPAPATAEQAAP